MTSIDVLLLIVLPALGAAGSLLLGIVIGRNTGRRPQMPSLDDHYHSLPVSRRPEEGTHV